MSQWEEIKSEYSSGREIWSKKPKILAMLTDIFSNPSKDTVCSPKGGLLKSQVHC